MERETAMKILKELHNKSLFAERTALETIIPEIKESEDEKIRKEIIEFVDINTLSVDERHDRWIAWLEKQCYTKKDVDDAYLKGISDAKNELEKQGEQNPTSDTRYEVKAGGSLSVNGKPFDYEKATITQKDFASKQEPKFNVGDYIVSDYCMGRVVEITNDAYLLDTGQGIPFSCHSTRLWDITKDAKDGDVVFDKSDGTIGIFQSIGHHPDGGSFNDSSYCFLHCRYDDEYFFADFEDGNIMTSYDVIPATKEQRDLLFAKMKEAGYEWDAEKKELKKIEQKPADKVEPKFKVGDWVVQGYNILKIKCVGNTYYCFETIGGYVDDMLISELDSQFHLWTIADAKDGDVLISQNGNPLIYNGNYNSLYIGAYCGITCDDNKFKVAEEKCHWTENVDTKPSTKEQRDTLEKAMADAGYTFDFDKKELKKIEDEIEIPFGAKDSELQEETYFIPDGFHAEIDDDKVVIKKGEKPTAWSEEDEEFLRRAINATKDVYHRTPNGT